MLRRWLVLSLVVCEHTLSQPITEEKENVRTAQQFDFVECCPCPGSGFSGAEVPNVSDLTRSSASDCPCRLRGADSDGASSIFLPKTLTPHRNFVSPVDSREDPKPLLHPEVGLASSVLETLREATDEEYRDALARDAARSAVRASDPDEPVDSITETAKNIVTIILNPKSTEVDVVSPEASNVEETRLQPLGSYQVRDTPNSLQGILLPKVDKSSPKKFLDLNNHASSIKERVEGINKGLEGLKLRANPQSNLLPNKFKQLHDENLKKIKLHSSKIPDFRLNPALSLKKPISRTNPIGDLRANKLPKMTIPRLRLNNARKINSDTDNNPSPSNIQEQFLDSSENNKDISHFRLNSLLPKANNGPLSLTNLLNLKDVELIPSKMNRAKLAEPKNISNQEDSDEDRNINTATNIQVISKEKSVKTEILDALPSPSENQQVVVVNDNSVEATTVRLEDDSQKADPCIPDFHKTTKIAGINKISEDVPKEDSNNDIETITSEGDSSITEDKEEQANQQQNQEETNLGNLVKENTQSSDQDPAASSPAVTIQHIEVFDYEDEDSERKEIDPPNQVGNEEEMVNSDLSEREDYSDNVENDHDYITGASNVVKIVSQENSEDINEKNNFKIEESCLDDDEVLVKSKKPLEIIKDSNISGVSKMESLETQDDEKTVAHSSIEKENDATDLINSDKSGENTDNSNEVNIQDLEQLSNSILDLSNKKQQKDIADAKKIVCESNSDVASFKTNVSVEQDTDNELNKNNSEEEKESSDLDQSATSLDTQILETITSPTVSIDTNDETDNTERQEISDITNNAEVKTCLTDSSKISPAQETEGTVSKLSSDTDANEIEMTAEATAPLITVVSEMTSKSNEDNAPGSSQRQSAIVQPSSLFGGNSLDIFRRPIQPLPNLLNVNPKIPTLEEIQSSISSLFGMQQRNADDDDFSTEFDSSNDCSNRNTVMSSDASTRSSNRLLLPLKPIEDINIDIFQLSPSSQDTFWTPKIPVLNLNSYKGKLAIPKSLDLKPMQFESALGNKGSLLGASFSVGPKRIGSEGRAKSKTKSGSNFNNNGRTALENRFGKLPSINDLKINTPRMNPLGDHLRASQTISDNLRTHTEKTMKNIQQSLASTLNEAKVRDVDKLGTKLAKPEDLFEMVSTAHDDMTDKLKGIHYDLNERLTSLHDKIADQTRLPSLSIPVVKDTKFAFKPLSKMSTRYESKQPTPRMRTQSKSLGKGNDPSLRVSKPQPSLRFSSPQTRTDEQKFKPFKISTAASSLTPKSVEVPKLTTMPAKYTFSRPLLRDSNVQLKETKSPLFTAKEHKKSKNNNKPNRMQNFKPFGDTQVKVSFSTTPRPNTQEKPTVVSFITPKPQTKPSLRKSEKVTMPRNNLVRNSDSKGFASEVKSSRIPSSFKPSKSDNIDSRDADEIKGSSQLMSKGNALHRVDPSRKKEITKGAKTVSENKPLKFKSNMPSWPSTTESAFLSKVREALKSRFSTADPSPTTQITSTVNLAEDTARSASENNELIVVKEEPLKENVSYKCKMVCVKDP